MELTIRELTMIRSALRSLWLEASESPEDMELLAKVTAEIERRESLLEELSVQVLSMERDRSASGRRAGFESLRRARSNAGLAAEP